MNPPHNTNSKTPSPACGEGMGWGRALAGASNYEDLGSLPRDPFMLMSTINMKLRDQYPSLDALCDDLGVSRAAIDAVLTTAGFEYNEQQNKYW